MSYIESTWIAYAHDRPAEREQIGQALERVRAHYAGLYVEPLRDHRFVEPAMGMALWRRDDPRLRWPSWACDADWTVATTNPIAAWRTLVDVEVERAALELGRVLAAEPERLAALTPPFVLAALHARSERLVIVNDSSGSARLFELRTPQGYVWSNRPAALLLFAGVEPEPDPEGWAIHAASGWFLGSTTPFRGVTKVRPGSAITVHGSDSGATVSRVETSAVRQLVTPRRASLSRQASEAARASVSLASSIAKIWTVPPTINLSGGRDSRISAAGVVAAGTEAGFRTMDIEPGEVEAARMLLGALPQPVDHGVLEMASREGDQSLRARIQATHLVHDGLANPMGGQGSVDVPQAGFVAPLVTGHGGEIAHGFYYDRRSLIRDHTPATRARLMRRLERAGRQKHNAGREDAFALYLGEVERTLDEGEAHGVKGASLLDFFYLAERLPYRAGLGSRNDRYSACVTPEFVRGSFDLRPWQRTRARLHAAVVRELVPAWSSIPFFHGGGGRMRPMKRARVWERRSHASEVEEMLASPDLWSDVFDPGRVQAMWSRATAGEGHSHYEAVFMRIAWRACFLEHVRDLRRETDAPPPSSIGPTGPHR